MTKPATKNNTNFRLTKTSIETLEKTATSMGISRTSVMELLIRHYADRLRTVMEGGQGDNRDTKFEGDKEQK